MKQIRVNITEEEYEALKERLEGYELTPAGLLREFVADATDSEHSNGSDERMYADQYIGRLYANHGKF